MGGPFIQSFNTLKIYKQPIQKTNMSSQGIAIRRVSVTSPQDMPTKGIAETPGGTIFGTTPGGTRIIYDRLFLLKQKGSNLSRTPPVNLPAIPGVTQDLHRRVSVVPEENTEEEKTSKKMMLLMKKMRWKWKCKSDENV